MRADFKSKEPDFKAKEPDLKAKEPILKQTHFWLKIPNQVRFRTL